MTTIEDTTPPAQAPDAPAPLLDGTFALYKHQGGFLVAWKKRGEANTRHLPIPSFVFQMASNASGKSIEEIIAELTGEGAA